ncbi:MAG: hypothetical protein ACKV2T_07300 [Kofleriaceae bacterium]
MKLTDRRALTTMNGLSTQDLEQLAVIGSLFFGAPGPVTIDDDFAADPLPARVLMSVDHWKVVDGSTHAYDVWTYMGDSGVVFRAGAAQPVAEIIQGGLECDDDALGAALDQAIHDAYNPAKKASKKKTAATPKKKTAATPKKKTAAKPKQPKKTAAKPKQPKKTAAKPKQPKKTAAKKPVAKPKKPKKETAGTPKKKRK